MLILVRHGRTPANAEGRLQGRLDQQLDAVGRQQAAQLGRYLDQRFGSIDQLISSPLRRAIETASYLGDDLIIDDRWVELSYGEFEGTPHSEVPSEVWQRWQIDPLYVPEGGESLAELDRRVRLACDELCERSREQTVVVVSHVSPIKSAVAWALGTDLGISWRSHLSQAAICRIEIRRSGPVLASFNELASNELAP
jgi:alpha-ribazole phosphatase